MSERKDYINGNNDSRSAGKLSNSADVNINPRLRLFYVTYFNGDGNRMDLLVWSETLEGVPDHWRNHFHEEEELDCIFEVPIAAPRLGPVRWHTPGGACCVFDRIGKGGARNDKLYELPLRVQKLLAAKYNWPEEKFIAKSFSNTDREVKETSEIKDDCNTDTACELSTPPNVGVAQPLRLYFVDHWERELFVWSETVDDVANHWRDHYELYDYDDEESDEPCEAPDPDRIVEISIAAPRSGVVVWHALWEKRVSLSPG